MFKFLPLKNRLAFFLVATLFILPNLGHAQGVMRIAAVVNDDVISALDLAQRVRLTIATTRLPNTPEVRKRLTSTILRTMIDERLKTQAAEEAGVEITEQQLQNGLNRYAQSQKVKPEMLEKALGQIGVDLEVLEDQARAELAWGFHIRRNSRDRLKVADSEVTAALQAIEANKGKPEYLYSEIFLPVDVPSEEAGARQMAERLVGHIQNGSPFAALARDFSKSPSAVKDGNLGWVQSGNMNPDIEAILGQLPLGGYSNPIRTAAGFYLLHLQDKRISGQQDRDELLDLGQIILQATPADQEGKRELARTLAFQVKACGEMEGIAKGLPGANHSMVKDLKLSTLSGELRQALTNVGQGQTTVHERKQGSIIVIMVCKREKLPAPPEVKVRKDLKEKIRQEKIAREDRRLLQQIRRAAFVDIRL
ncbi:peptidylprolyl isomerase [Terasakiella sp. A23]|uniref:peptidylprolyl isomerase n=1 Tax=Terasakiella sp. FCG-A23 TaxID=3080561 RepID=UPI0029556AD8|nr:peptidylprolyl isomerase [Terasakiella sp. A23]MDV7340162.1 peptidylprolyl isomerase [Terasakiella sp. A23]